MFLLVTETTIPLSIASIVISTTKLNLNRVNVHGSITYLQGLKSISKSVSIIERIKIIIDKLCKPIFR